MRPVKAGLSGTSTARNQPRASIVRCASGWFGSIVATWSPASTPSAAKPAAQRNVGVQLRVGDAATAHRLEGDGVGGLRGPAGDGVRGQVQTVEHGR